MSEVVREVTVDRIEGSVAVLLDGAAQVDVPTSWLPPETGEGSVLIVTVRRDPEAENVLRERIRKAQERLTSGDDDDDEIEL